MKRSLRHWGWVTLMTAVMITGMTMTAMASGSLRLRFENGSRSTWGEDPKEPVVTANGTEIGVEWSKDVEDWTPGKKVTGTIVVDGQFVRSQCTVYGAERTSVKPSDGQTTIKVTYVPVVKLGAPERAGWSDSSQTRASWKKVRHASKYQLRLYRDNEWVKTVTTGSTVYDLLEFMQDGFSYSYEVRAIAKDNDQEKYLEDGDFVWSGDSVIQELGDTSGRWYTYNEGKKYRDSDGNYASAGWRMITGKWYLFNADGYALTGWQTVEGKWYYLDTEGVMAIGWTEINGKWYYLNEQGVMMTGWVETQPGMWYYLNDDGSMAASTVIDGYTVNESGLRQ